MLDANSEARLKEVHPELSLRVHRLSDMLSFPIIVTQGRRNYSQQEALYQQGRTTPGKIVTHAKPEQSAHCFLYAVDVAPADGLGGIDWNGKDEKWQEILTKAPSCGLAEGAQWRTFVDEPHLYLQELPATPDDELVSALRAGGIETVYQVIDVRLLRSS